MSQEKAQLIAPIGIMTVSGVTATGVITATSLSGNIAGAAKSLVNGTDVTTGVITATSFVGNLTGNILRLADSAPDINVGASTATSFVGNLTGSVTDLTSAPNITVGVVTATTFEGPVTGNVTGNATGLAGGLGVNYNGGWTGAGTSQINAGVVTATTFYGDGSNLDGVSSGPVSQQSIGITSAATAIDLSNGNIIYAEQSASTTVSFANTANGNVYFIRRDDDSGTLRTITWPTGIGWSGGNTPTLVNNTRTTDAQVFLLITRDMGVTWYGKEVVNIDPTTFALFTTGRGGFGATGQNDLVDRSSPTQVGGQANWANNDGQADGYGAVGNCTGALKTDGTLWQWGRNYAGHLGFNDTVNRSSPTQVGTDTTWSSFTLGSFRTLATKTDGTLWIWGQNTYGGLGLNTGGNEYSSPTQIGTSTDWTTGESSKLASGPVGGAIKTDGSLWIWGSNQLGGLGLNQYNPYPSNTGVSRGISSPAQIPGTWKSIRTENGPIAGLKTDGTLWTWGEPIAGILGLNDNVQRSSPTQVGTDTTWSRISFTYHALTGIKSDGTLWSWGQNEGTRSKGQLGQNDHISRSSPMQIGTGTDWSTCIGSRGYNWAAIKTDGSLWTWGSNNYGSLGVNVGAPSPTTGALSSPTQVAGTWLRALQNGNGLNVLKT